MLNVQLSQNHLYMVLYMNGTSTTSILISNFLGIKSSLLSMYTVYISANDNSDSPTKTEITALDVS